MAKKKLFTTNANALAKVLTQLDYSQSMTFTQVIVSGENKLKLETAREKVREAINLLRDIK